jgi:hypothetical protein
MMFFYHAKRYLHYAYFQEAKGRINFVDSSNRLDKHKNFISIICKIIYERKYTQTSVKFMNLWDFF